MIKPGDIVDERYELGRLLGEGGYGVVYLARQISTGQEVAIKFLLSNRLRGQDTWVEHARFKREMKVIGQLKHPNIVRLVDSGMYKESLYMVLEYIEGATLFRVVRDEGALPLDEVGHVMFQVLDALCAAHERGVIHRDLKPHNIMLTKGGLRRSAMVLDFGVAGIQKQARNASYVSLTADTEVQGTPAYIAPEQLRQGPLTPLSDIYAWGLVFIEAVSGEPAVTGDNTFEIALRQADDQPIEVPSDILDDGLREILGKAVAKDLSKRYQSAQEALKDLEEWLGARAASGRWSMPGAASVSTQKEQKQGQRRLRWLTPFILLVLLLGIGGWFLARNLASRVDEPSPACVADKDCPEGALCGDGGCESYQEVGCRLVEGKKGDKPRVLLAVFGAWGRARYEPRLRAIQLAAQEFAEAGGFGDERELLVLACDTSREEAKALDASRRVAALQGDVFLGPSDSGNFIEVINHVSRPEGILTISFGATHAGISSLADDGVAWRTVPSDEVQVDAMVSLLQEEGAKHVLVFSQKGTYGAGLMNDFTSKAMEVMKVEAASYGPEDDLSNLTSALYRPEADWVLILGSERVMSIVDAYESLVTKGSGPKYLLSDSSFRPELLHFADQDALRSRLGVMGPVKGSPGAFDAMMLRLKAHFDVDERASKVANAYDAAYLALYSVVVGGAPNASMRRLNEGEEISVGPVEVSRVVKLLHGGASINLRGASGPLDFDLETGDVPGDMALWEIQAAQPNQEADFVERRRYSSAQQGWQRLLPR